MKYIIISLLTFSLFTCTEKPKEQKLNNIFDPLANFDDIPPIIKVKHSPDSGIVNETTFVFDASGSTENDIKGANLFYLWDTNDDGWDTLRTTNPVFKKKFESGGGDKKVNLRVFGAKNLYSDTSFYVYVNSRPTILLDWVRESTFFRFDASSSFDAEDGHNLEFRWDFNSDDIWEIDWDTSSVAEYNYADEDWRLTIEARDQHNLTRSKKIDLTLSLNPKAVYLFSGNANDDSGHENNGTIYGATLTTDRFGNSGSAFLFDGVDDYIDIGNDQSLKPQFPLSVSAWVNISKEGPNAFFTNDFNDGYYFGFIAYVSIDGRVGLQYGNGKLVGPDRRRGFLSTESLIQNNQWYHIVLVAESYNSIRIYVNGVKADFELTGEGTFTTITYDNNSANIGRYDSGQTIGLNHFFNGKIDDIYLFDIALNEEQVYYLYNY